MHYVLLGKLQPDRIEGRFGYLRMLAGGNFWASVRQFFEGEAVIRVKSLVWLSGYSLGTVASVMEDACQQRRQEDAEVVEALVEPLVLCGAAIAIGGSRASYRSCVRLPGPISDEDETMS